VRYRDPLTHEWQDGTLTRDVVAGVVRLFAYVPQLSAMLPQSLAEAAAGRPDVLMAQGRMIESLVGEQINQGLQLSVSCSEDADRLRVDPADANTLMGTAFVATLLAQCEAWPRGRRPADFNEPVRSDRPVLLLSGEFDPVTPPRYGEQVLGHLPNGRHLIARGQGHNVMVAGCAPRLMARFVASADATGLDASCLERLDYTPPFTGSFGWEP
jgi:pimeloyl-ACP methyl ester carboxylesterase